MNNLRKFNWITQYNSAKEGEELVKPSVSLVIDKAVVIYDYTPPKFMATYDDGRTYKLECDGNPTLTSGNTRPSGYDYTKMTSAAIGDCVTSIGNGTFANCTSLTSIVIPDSVTSIGNQAFQGCTSLTSIVIPDSVTSIGGGAFWSCTSLLSITIPSGVTSIGDWAFQSCSSLTSIVIPNSVETIGVSAFGYCTSLTSVTIGSNVISIGRSAFNETKNVKYLTSYAITPPTLGNYALSDLRYSVLDVYVPDVSINAYRSASGWWAFASRIKPISQKP